jgi:peptidoglycan/xylan/chitin deacetylase (PgdA/CDA1 family)
VFDLTLSFDNGPEPEVTPRVLDALGKRGIKATSSSSAARSPKRRRLSARAHEEGHWIGNHTYTHSMPLGLQRDADTANTRSRAQDLIGALAHPQRWFRPFGGGGNLDDRLLNLRRRSSGAGGYGCVLWNSYRATGTTRVGPIGRWRNTRAGLEPDGAARFADRRDAPSRNVSRFAVEAAPASVRNSRRTACRSAPAGSCAVNLCINHRRKRCTMKIAVSDRRRCKLWHRDRRRHHRCRRG